jgi:type II secretory pathway component PulF
MGGPTQFYTSGPDLLLAAIAAVALIAIWLTLSFGALYLIYFLLTLPMRRNERARLFLDLVELGIRDGRTPEESIIAASASRDRSLGARFHFMSTCLERGRKLSEALDDVPRLLPPQVTAMLKAGQRIGDITKMFPACRRLLADSVSQVRGAINYILLLVFVVTPFALGVPLFIKVKIIPAYLMVFEGMMEGAMLPAFTRLVFATNSYFLEILAVVFVFIWVLALAYIGGPRLRAWVHGIFPHLTDRILYSLPWRRKRLHRDFTAVLAILLDAEVPEAEAVRLAADATANFVVQGRAEKVREGLGQGMRLTDAIRRLERAGEFQWRLVNALHRGSGFLKALSGWHDSLDAKAFQQEQIAAQLTTTALVLFNALVVSSIVIAVFLALISLLYSATLW